MVVKLFFFIIMALSALQAQESKIQTKIEASLYLPNPSGTIENGVSISDIQDDFKFETAKASYFSIETTFDYDYVPNIYISYFNLNDSTNSELNSSKRVGPVDFNSTVNTEIRYQILSGVLYQDFKNKLEFNLFGTPFYLGDLELDIGLNIEYLKWDFNIKDASQSRWINVNELVGRPYFGLKYYFYYLSLYANISALSINSTDSTSAQAGIDYNFDDGVSIGVGYMYENFNVVEKTDTIDYTTSGLKAGFKYTF